MRDFGGERAARGMTPRSRRSGSSPNDFRETPKRINPPLRRMEALFRRKNPAISRTLSAVLAVVLLLAVVAGAYFLSQRTNSNAPREIDIRIIEDNPVLQSDHFYPDNATAKLNENVTLAIQNGDDELRYFTIKEFNVNLTLPAGTAGRVSFQANRLGTFAFFSPATPPSAVSNGKPGPALDGNFTVSQ
jgi:Cupredoxin-like domain